MEKSTLKGKVKVLTYIAAFIFMVGVHMAMDKSGANKNETDKAGQTLVERSVQADNGLLSNDSLFADKENIETVKVEKYKR